MYFQLLKLTKGLYIPNIMSELKTNLDPLPRKNLKVHHRVIETDSKFA